jgi:hypothetical protein
MSGSLRAAWKLLQMNTGLFALTFAEILIDLDVRVWIGPSIAAIESPVSVPAVTLPSIRRI